MWRRSVSVAVVTGVVSVVTALAMATPGAADGGHKIRIFDDCDPTSFNAAVAPGTCTGDGETTFGQFIEEVTATQAAADWRFKPSMLRIHEGRPVILENRGGETHTFTLVPAFGGGFVDVLNTLSGNPEPAPECASKAADGTLVPQPPSPVNVFVAADQEETFATKGMKPGKYMFECCVHPWMRVILTIRD